MSSRPDRPGARAAAGGRSGNPPPEVASGCRANPAVIWDPARGPGPGRPRLPVGPGPWWRAWSRSPSRSASPIWHCC